MADSEPFEFGVTERRKSIPTRGRPITSYMPVPEPLHTPDRRQSRRSFHLPSNSQVFDWTPFEQHSAGQKENADEPIYDDPFSSNTLAPLPPSPNHSVRRHSSLAQSFKNGFSAMTRRMSNSVRSGKGKPKEEDYDSPRPSNALSKRRSQLFDFSESGNLRPRTRGLLNTLAGRRRPSMPLLNWHRSQQEGEPVTSGSLPADEQSDLHASRLALLSPYVSGGHGARAAAAAQNEAMLLMRETPLPTYDAATSPSSEIRDSESGIGINVYDDTRTSSASPVARCDPRRYLATELMEQIFSHLDAQSLLNAELVSKSWAELSRSQTVWRDVFYRDYASSRPGRISSRPSTPGMGKNTPGQDYRKFYTVRKMIDNRWKNGEAAAIYLNGHKDSVYCVQFDERKIITGSRDNTIRVWDARTYQCLRKLGPPNNLRERIQLQRAEVEPTGIVPFFKCETSSPDPKTPALSMWHEASVLCLQYDDDILVTGSSDFSCIVWSIKDGYKPMFRLLGHAAGVLDVCIDPLRIVTCSKDTTIKIWDRFTGNLLRTLHGHRGPVNAVQVRGNLLASASGDGMSKLWRLEDGQCIKEFHSRERGLACVEFSEDGRTIFAGGNDHVIYEYNTVTGNIERELAGHKDLVRSLHLDSASGRIVSGSYDHSIKVWNSKQGQTEADGGLKINLEGWTSSWMLAAKSNYRKIACASQDGRVVIVDFGYGIDGVHLVEA